MFLLQRDEVLIWLQLASSQSDTAADQWTRSQPARQYRDHAREHERKSSSASRLGTKVEIHQAWPGPIKCWRVACAQVAIKPNRKAGCVNRPADALNIWHPTPAGLLTPSSPPAEQATTRQHQARKPCTQNLFFGNMIEGLRLCNLKISRMRPLYFERAQLAAKNKCLAQSNKSRTRSEATDEWLNPGTRLIGHGRDPAP